VKSASSDIRGLFRIEGAPNVIIDTIKRGDDDDFLSSSASKSVICRIYESKGGHAKATLTTTLPIAKASIVDLLERKIEDLEIVSSQAKDESGKQSVKLNFRGFQVVTVKFEL
jgi:alpha-mannosidase